MDKLYESKEDCCKEHKDLGCLTVMPTSAPTMNITLPPIGTLPPIVVDGEELEVKWYPVHSDDGVYQDHCQYDNSYPSWMAGGSNADKYLFDSELECCNVFGCIADDSGLGGALEEDKKWYPSTEGEAITCEFGSTYDAGTIDLFDSEEECCALFGCEGSTGSTVISSTSTPETITDPTDTVNDETNTKPPSTVVVLPIFAMNEGPCASDSNCQSGLVCHTSTQKCICNSDTNAGCSGGEVCGVPPGAYCPVGGCTPSCHCDTMNDIGGTNGCREGQVCRTSCIIADGGPQCFDDDRARDCSEMHGEGWICRDSNGDGVIDANDGGSGCEKDPNGMVPNLGGGGSGPTLVMTLPTQGSTGGSTTTAATTTPAATTTESMVTMSNGLNTCPAGECLSPEGNCAPESSCFVNPCDIIKCAEGTECVANYCGGCTGSCVNSMVENSATLAPDTTTQAATTGVASTITQEPTIHEVCPQGSCHNPQGICEAEASCAVDPCNNRECEEGYVCQTNYCGGCHAICAMDEMVENGPSMPTDAATTEAPKTTTEEPTTTVPATTTESSDCQYKIWHRSQTPGALYTCSNAEGYPATWGDVEGHLFDDAKSCCESMFAGKNCGIEDMCDVDMETTTTVAPDTQDPDCPFTVWHMSIVPGEKYACSNSDDFPPSWRGAEGYLFKSSKECCDALFGGSCQLVIDKCEDYEPATTTTTTVPPGDDSCPHRVWHMSTFPNSKYTCSNDKHFPSAWNNVDGYLFGSSRDCCDTLFAGKECVIKDECECSHNKWHISTVLGENGTCSNSKDYPSSWNTMAESFLFETAEACCETAFDGEACAKKDVCIEDDDAKDDVEETVGCIDSWHVNLNNMGGSCTNSGHVLDAWPDSMKGYENGKDCCIGYYGGPCEEVDTCPPEEPSAGCADSWHVVGETW